MLKREVAVGQEAEEREEDDETGEERLEMSAFGCRLSPALHEGRK